MAEMQISRSEALQLVRAAIDERGISQTALAELVGVSRGYLNQWLGGARLGSDSLAEKICRVLELDAVIYAALIEEQPSDDQSRYEQMLDDQLAASEVWVILPWFAIANERKALEKFVRNLNTVRYVFWSSDEASLTAAIIALESSRTEVKTEHFVCVKGPDWLDLAPWRLIDPISKTRRAQHLRTNSGVIETGIPADSWVADRLFKVLFKILLLVRSGDGEHDTPYGKFERLYPRRAE